MKYHFDPQEIQVLRKAFDTAWRELEKEANAANCEAVRDHIGRAIVHLAMDGKLSEERLASYAAYQGRRYLGTTIASINVARKRAET